MCFLTESLVYAHLVILDDQVAECLIHLKRDPWEFALAKLGYHKAIATLCNRFPTGDLQVEVVPAWYDYQSINLVVARLAVVVESGVGLDIVERVVNPPHSFSLTDGCHNRFCPVDGSSILLQAGEVDVSLVNEIRHTSRCVVDTVNRFLEQSQRTPPKGKARNPEGLRRSGFHRYKTS